MIILLYVLLAPLIVAFMLAIFCILSIVFISFVVMPWAFVLDVITLEKYDLFIKTESLLCKFLR